MAEMNLNTLVLRGVTVVGDVLTGKMGIGCYPAMVQTPSDCGTGLRAGTNGYVPCLI